MDFFKHPEAEVLFTALLACVVGESARGRESYHLDILLLVVAYMFDVPRVCVPGGSDLGFKRRVGGGKLRKKRVEA